MKAALRQAISQLSSTIKPILETTKPNVYDRTLIQRCILAWNQFEEIEKSLADDEDIKNGRITPDDKALLKSFFLNFAELFQAKWSFCYVYLTSYQKQIESETPDIIDFLSLNRFGAQHKTFDRAIKNALHFASTQKPDFSKIDRILTDTKVLHANLILAFARQIPSKLTPAYNILISQPKAKDLEMIGIIPNHKIEEKDKPKPAISHCEISLTFEEAWHQFEIVFSHLKQMNFIAQQLSLTDKESLSDFYFLGVKLIYAYWANWGVFFWPHVRQGMGFGEEDTSLHSENPDDFFGIMDFATFAKYDQHTKILEECLLTAKSLIAALPTSPRSREETIKTFEAQVRNLQARLAIPSENRKEREEKKNGDDRSSLAVVGPFSRTVIDTARAAENPLQGTLFYNPSKERLIQRAKDKDGAAALTLRAQTTLTEPIRLAGPLLKSSEPIKEHEQKLESERAQRLVKNPPLITASLQTDYLEDLLLDAQSIQRKINNLPESATQESKELKALEARKEKVLVPLTSQLNKAENTLKELKGGQAFLNKTTAAQCKELNQQISKLKRQLKEDKTEQEEKHTQESINKLKFKIKLLEQDKKKQQEKINHLQKLIQQAKLIQQGKIPGEKSPRNQRKRSRDQQQPDAETNGKDEKQDPQVMAPASARRNSDTVMSTGLDGLTVSVQVTVTPAKINEKARDAMQITKTTAASSASHSPASNSHVDKQSDARSLMLSATDKEAERDSPSLSLTSETDDETSKRKKQKTDHRPLATESDSSATFGAADFAKKASVSPDARPFYQDFSEGKLDSPTPENIDRFKRLVQEIEDEVLTCPITGVDKIAAPVTLQESGRVFHAPNLEQHLKNFNTEPATGKTLKSRAFSDAPTFNKLLRCFGYQPTPFRMEEKAVECPKKISYKKWCEIADALKFSATWLVGETIKESGEVFELAQIRSGLGAETRSKINAAVCRIAERAAEDLADPKPLAREILRELIANEKKGKTTSTKAKPAPTPARPKQTAGRGRNGRAATRTSPTEKTPEPSLKGGGLGCFGSFFSSAPSASASYSSSSPASHSHMPPSTATGLQQQGPTTRSRRPLPRVLPQATATAPIVRPMLQPSASDAPVPNPISSLQPDQMAVLDDLLPSLPSLRSAPLTRPLPGGSLAQALSLDPAGQLGLSIARALQKPSAMSLDLPPEVPLALPQQAQSAAGFDSLALEEDDDIPTPGYIPFLVI